MNWPTVTTLATPEPDMVPIMPEAGWDKVKPFCRAFAEMMSQEEPTRFLPTLKKVDRRGRILLDWLRNGLGATAVASFCPRARPNAPVATPLAWDEVNSRLDPLAFTITSMSSRVMKLRGDPWEGFGNLRQKLPSVAMDQSAVAGKRKTRQSGKPVIVFAPKPKRRAQA